MTLKPNTFISLIALVITMATGFAQGQPPAGAAPAPGAAPAGAPGGGGRGGRGGAPALIDLATAKRMVDAAEASATAAGIRLGIAVVDANGDLVYVRRMDGATAQGVNSAQGKARAAILFGMTTKEIADQVAAGKPISATITPAGIGGGTPAIQQGGVPVFKDGKLIAAIGAGGAAPAADEVAAKAGADTVK
jgi:glc operon protein GlcG